VVRDLLSSHSSFGYAGFAIINVALIAVWLLLVAVIGRHYRKLTLAEVPSDSSMR